MLCVDLLPAKMQNIKLSYYPIRHSNLKCIFDPSGSLTAILNMRLPLEFIFRHAYLGN